MLVKLKIWFDGKPKRCIEYNCASYAEALKRSLELFRQTQREGDKRKIVEIKIIRNRQVLYNPKF